MSTKTQLQELKDQYPGLDYEWGGFHETPDHDEYLSDNEGVQIDADYLIRNHYSLMLNTEADSNYIKDELNGYSEAFKNI